MSDYSSESGHWYTQDGEPKYEMPYADPAKGMRPTTLRDARKLNLVPSVTTILGVPAKPFLNQWIIEQHLEAAFKTAIPIGGTLDYDEIYAAWKKQVREKANEISERTASEGSTIHGYVEGYYTGGDIVSAKAEPFIDAVEDALHREFGAQLWHSEKSFAHPYGFGGKVDLHSDQVLVDFKTKDTDKIDFKKPMAYDENIMQLAAYEHGLIRNDRLMANVFIGRELVGGEAVVKVEVHENSLPYWERFYHLMEYWKLKNGYDPSF